MNSPCPNTPDINYCTCDLWPDNEPHCHLGAMVEDGPPVPPVPPFWRPKLPDA